MSKDNIVVDMQSPTPIDSYRYKSVGEVNYKESKVVNVRDEDSRTSCNKITLATTLDKRERAEALRKQVNRIKSWRRKSVVDNKYHSRERKKLNPILIRPILREEKTW